MRMKEPLSPIWRQGLALGQWYQQLKQADMLQCNSLSTWPLQESFSFGLENGSKTHVHLKMEVSATACAQVPGHPEFA